jgi:hypothetical protein
MLSILEGFVQKIKLAGADRFKSIIAAIEKMPRHNIPILAAYLLVVELRGPLDQGTMDLVEVTFETGAEARLQQIAAAFEIADCMVSFPVGALLLGLHPAQPTQGLDEIVLNEKILEEFASALGGPPLKEIIDRLSDGASVIASTKLRELGLGSDNEIDFITEI